MALFNSSSPVYKTSASPNTGVYAPTAPSSGLASMFGSLIGGTKPVYKTLDGQAGQAPTSSGLLQIFVGNGPSYKTAPQATDLDTDDGDAGDADDTCSPPTDTVVVL